jgi:hypothetical protein
MIYQALVKENSIDTMRGTHKAWQSESEVARFGRNPYQTRKESSILVDDGSDGCKFLCHKNIKKKKISKNLNVSHLSNG